MIDIESRDLTPADREQALTAATVITMRELIAQGHNLHDIIAAWEDATGTVLPASMIAEMDRQRVAWPDED